MAIDGVETGNIESTLRWKLSPCKNDIRQERNSSTLSSFFGTGNGLVETLVGQVGMFGQLASTDIGALGYALAIAVVATMYRAIIANAICGPIGDKLGMFSSEEVLGREMMVQAIMSIQSGDNPRVTLDKMLAFIPTPGRARFRVAA